MSDKEKILDLTSSTPIYHLSKGREEEYKVGHEDAKITEETVVRFSNVGRQPKVNNPIKRSGREYCVGDYSCCSAIP
jgi:hypothetical protein